MLKLLNLGLLLICGDCIIILFLCSFVFLFIPLNKVFIMTFLLIFTGYVDHTSKILYRQERPLWLNEEIDVHSQHSCGYGNPSGHALSSSCLYFNNL